MRLRGGIAVSLLVIAQSTRFAPHASAQASPGSSSTGQASPPPAAPASRLNTAGMSHFELQRLLNELDERRRRLRTALEPADSALRILALDTARLLAATRPPELVRDSVTVHRLFIYLRQNPGSVQLRQQIADAIENSANDFVAIEQTLNARVTTPDNARDFMERSPYAAVVPFGRASPPSNTMLAATVSRPDTAIIPRIQLLDYLHTLSDSSYGDYVRRLLLAYAMRMGDVRLLAKTDRDEIARVEAEAAQVARDLGTREDAQSRLDQRLITIAIPAVAVALVAMLLVPLLYRSEELRRAIISSGLLFEMTTVFLLTAAVVILGIDGRISAEVIGTVLGGLSGYVLGRSVNPLSMRQ